MPGARIITFTVIFAFVSCKDRNDEDSQVTAQIDQCQEICVMQLCDPLYDPMFKDDPNVVCRRFCEGSAAEADEQACLDEHQELLDCLDGLSCSELLLWVEQDANMGCREQEQALEAACPSVEVPREAG